MSKQSFCKKLEPWEEKLVREADAIRIMRMNGMGPEVRGKRIAGSRLTFKKTQVATVGNRDKAAVHVGFAPDRIYG